MFTTKTLPISNQGSKTTLVPPNLIN